MTYDTDQLEDDQLEEAPLPIRPRRKLLTPATATLAAIATAAGGFYAGVRVEKGQTSGSSAVAGLGGGGGGGGGAGAGGFARLRALLGGGLGGGGGGGGGGSAGTVSTVDGSTIYLSEATGNTVKVTLSSATKVSKSQSTSRHAVRPGDTIAVQGVTKPGGTIVATSVTDSGAGAAPGVAAAGGVGGSAGTGSGSGSGGAGGRAAALSSLFQAGG
ncbi:MAG: DUF5666 domain-containing protein [Solirubrobacteraceae bacterium]